jgi:CheY-like chemotaxis protein
MPGRQRLHLVRPLRTWISEQPYEEGLMHDRIVLLADDDVDMQKLFEAALTSQQFRTTTAHDDAHALEIVRTERPELIVTNLGMPRLDGFALVEQLKRDPDTASIPVLAITAQPYPELQQRARMAGFDALLIKPVTGTTLLDVARLLVERAALLRQRSARLLQRGAALRERAAELRRDLVDHGDAAESPVPAADSVEPAGAVPVSPRCRRCGSDADCRVVRTTRSSVTYRCGMCLRQWRLTFKNTAPARSEP